MAFSPLGSRVVLRVDQAKTESEGGVILAANAVEVPMEATVVSVGPDTKVLHPNDRVLYPKWSGTEVTVDGEVLLLMNEAEVLGVFTA